MKYNDKNIWKVTKYNWVSIKESSHIDNTKTRKFYKQILLKSRNLFIYNILKEKIISKLTPET